MIDLQGRTAVVTGAGSGLGAALARAFADAGASVALLDIDDEAAIRREQTRAREPDVTGFVERDGGRVFWEAYGAGDPPIVFVPPWQIVHSRTWKAQVPDFARRHRVIAWDNRGNGRSDRPLDPKGYSMTAFGEQVVALLDHLGADEAVIGGTSLGSNVSLEVALAAPERVRGLLDTVWYLVIVSVLHTIRGWLGRPRVRPALEKLSGCVLLALGVRLVLDPR